MTESRHQPPSLTPCRAIPQPERRDKIAPLTSVRFFAALWVVLYHTMPRAEGGGIGFGEQLVDLGHAAVSMFFVLSGFILATVYRELRGQKVRRFFVARVARIYPMYVLSLLIDTPRLLIFRIAKAGIAKAVMTTTATFAFQAILLQSWIPDFAALNFPSWSISTEMFFYLSFPLALKLNDVIKTPVQRIAAILILWGAMIVLTLMLKSHHGAFFTSGVIWRNPVMRLPEFCIGILLVPAEARVHAIGLKAPWAVGTFAVAVATAFCAIVLAAPAIANARLVELAFLPVFAAGILLLAAWKSRVMRLLSVPALVLLGEASYALYLVHAPIAAFFEGAGFTSNHWLSLAFLSYLATAIAASIVAHLWFERPIRQWIMQRYDARTLARAATPQSPDELAGNAATTPSPGAQLVTDDAGAVAPPDLSH